MGRGGLVVGAYISKIALANLKKYAEEHAGSMVSQRCLEANNTQCYTYAVSLAAISLIR